MAAATAAAAVVAATEANFALPAVDDKLCESLSPFAFAFTICDPSRAENPIIFASEQFEHLTGYTKEEAIGRSCTFLHGPETSHRSLMEVRDALREERSCQVCMMCHKKDGSRFWNQLYLSPVRSQCGRVLQYVCIQADVTTEVERSRQEQLAELGRPASSDDGCDMDDEAPEVVRLERHEAQEVQQVLKANEPQGSARAAVAGDAQYMLPCSLRQALCNIQQSFVLVDPSLPDAPIVHASQHFLDMCGYPRDLVVGRNCRFLQGPGTDMAEVGRMRAAIKADEPQPVTVTILNYRADGRPFWNCLHVAPVRDAAGRVIYFLGVQLDVNKIPTPRLSISNSPLEALAATRAASMELPPARPPPVPSLTQKMAHKSVTGAVRVAVRGLGGEGPGLRRSEEHQGLPHAHHRVRLPGMPHAASAAGLLYVQGCVPEEDDGKPLKEPPMHANTT